MKIIAASWTYIILSRIITASPFMIVEATVAEVLLSDSAVSIFATAVEDNGYDAVLAANDSNHTHTLFAPIDDAINGTGSTALSLSLWMKLQVPDWSAHLEGLFQYHTVAGSLPLSSVLQLQNNEIETLLSQKQAPDHIINITASNATGAVEVNGYAFNHSRVLDEGVQVSNGILYRVDRLFLPTFLRLDLFAIGDAISFLSALLQLTVSVGLEDTLRTSSALTWFAPTNAAFARMTDPSTNPDVVRHILEYHIVPGVYPSRHMFDRQSLPTLTKHALIIRVNGTDPLLCSVNGFEPMLLDVLGANGIMHVIDQVLIPPGFAPTSAPGTTSAPFAAEAPPTLPPTTLSPLPNPTRTPPLTQSTTTTLLPTDAPVVVTSRNAPKPYLAWAPTLARIESPMTAPPWPRPTTNLPTTSPSGNPIATPSTSMRPSSHPISMHRPSRVPARSPQVTSSPNAPSVVIPTTTRTTATSSHSRSPVVAATVALSLLSSLVPTTTHPTFLTHHPTHRPPVDTTTNPHHASSHPLSPSLRPTFGPMEVHWLTLAPHATPHHYPTDTPVTIATHRPHRHPTHAPVNLATHLPSSLVPTTHTPSHHSPTHEPVTVATHPPTSLVPTTHRPHHHPTHAPVNLTTHPPSSLVPTTHTPSHHSSTHETVTVATHPPTSLVPTTHRPHHHPTHAPVNLATHRPSSLVPTTQTPSHHSPTHETLIVATLPPSSLVRATRAPSQHYPTDAPVAVATHNPSSLFLTTHAPSHHHHSHAPFTTSSLFPATHAPSHHNPNYAPVNHITAPIVPPQSNSGGGAHSLGVIVGGAIGGAVVLVGLVAYVWSQRSKSKQDNKFSGGEGDHHPGGPDDDHLQPTVLVEVPTVLVEVPTVLVEVPTALVEVVGDDDISSLEDPSFVKIESGTTIRGDPDQGVATVDYDFSKAFGDLDENSVVSSAGGTFGLESIPHTGDHNALTMTNAASNRDAGQIPGSAMVGGAWVLADKEILEIVAPAGKLGFVIDTRKHGVPVVHALKASSVVADKIRVGDRLVAVDDIDVTEMSALKVSKLIIKRSAHPARKFTIVRSCEPGPGE